MSRRFAILGEDVSDAETLRVFVKRLGNDAPVKIRGYGGCGELLRKGWKQLKAFRDDGCNRFIVALDSDGIDPIDRRNEILNRVVNPAGLDKKSWCIVVPVEEIEAWILADLPAVTKVFSGWTPKPFGTPPESIHNPKERLERESRTPENKRPRYTHAIHNQKVAEHLDLTEVERRCPSFGPLVKFVTDKN
ncbi:MAG: DUF4276 family protein [Planctomycetales bacterium]